MLGMLESHLRYAPKTSRPMQGMTVLHTMLLSMGKAFTSSR